MTFVVRRQREPNIWESTGRKATSLLDTFLQGGMQQAQMQDQQSNRMMQFGMQERNRLDQNARFDKQWAEQKAMQDRQFAQQDKMWGEKMALKKMELTNKQNGPSMPQMSYTDLVKKAAVDAMGVPEDKRTESQKIAIELGKAYGIKPSGPAELELLPMDTGARKQAFSLRSQWDEATRVQKAYDEFNASGGTAGTGLIIGSMPTTIANRMDPKGTVLRSAISQMSSVIMNELSGAAVSDQERVRLEGFLPTARDDAETLQRKLDGYKGYLSTKAGSWRTTYGGIKPLEGVGSVGDDDWEDVQ